MSGPTSSISLRRSFSRTDAGLTATGVHLGQAVEVFSRTEGRWLPGRLSNPQREGHLTVDFTLSGGSGSARKHLRPDSGKIRFFVDGDSDARSTATDGEIDPEALLSLGFCTGAIARAFCGCDMAHRDDWKRHRNYEIPGANGQNQYRLPFFPEEEVVDLCDETPELGPVAARGNLTLNRLPLRRKTSIEFAALAEAFGFKRCPGCNEACEKEDEWACDHITCRCGHEFCWICFADRRVIFHHGNHFHRPSCKYYFGYTGPLEYRERCPECCRTGRPCRPSS
mmetsp:Transcript_68761/g.149651  ORF Transcript_68761/g.149651 Transcript_68761/m.149651 type:complete len:282 (+) Transcript_68761:72-917(+)